jgi:hypothetical protein
MKQLVVAVLLTIAGTALGQGAQLPLTFKGACKGNQTDIKDLSPIRDTPAVKCDSMLIMQIKGHTVVSFSNGDPTNPVLAFAGDLTENHISQPFDPYIGPVLSFFAIDDVVWGDGGPMAKVQAAEHMTGTDALVGRVCDFHFNGQGWDHLTEVECELTVDGPNHRPRYVATTFKAERQFTVDGKQISVEYGIRGANSFFVEFNKMKIEGTCGLGLYQINGDLKHVETGTPIDRLFQIVCYKDVANSH